MTRRLKVRGVWPSNVGTLIPVETQPAKAVQDRLQRLLQIALLVRVVDPEDVLAAVVAGEEPVEQRRPDTADVEMSGRTRCETRADGHIGGMRERMKYR